MSNLLYGNYRTRKFTDIYPSATEFLTDYDGSSELENGIPTTITEENARTLYYLLYARFGNSHIANSDETQFKYKIFSTIFQYGPTWEKRLEVQKSLRALNEAELMAGSKQINDHAYNPSTIVDNGPNPVSGEIETTNEQTRTKYQRGKMDAYAMLMSLLEKDVTEEFLGKFKKLFLYIVEPQEPLWYETDLIGGNE